MFFYEDNPIIIDQLKAKLAIAALTHVLIIYLYLATLKIWDDEPFYFGDWFLNFIRMISTILLHF